MSLFSRAMTSVLVCAGLAACAGSTPPADPAAGVASERSSHSSGMTYGDKPVRVVDTASSKLSVKGDPRLGNAFARIGIVEFSDYQCSFCRLFHQNQFRQIKAEYIDAGLVQFIHKDLPLRTHREAVPAARAAHCAGAQGRFWDMHDALFAHQERLGHGLYPELARQLRLDETNFKNCFEGQAYMRSIGQDAELARRLGLPGTPSFLIGTIEGDVLTIVRQSSGAPAFAAFAREIEKLRRPAEAP